MIEQSGWYFTAPWDPVSVRRGDALGFRAGADYFADLLAPGLSNGTSDARWITLLSWCLKWSHVVWRNAGGVDLAQREAQKARYAWLRPLELLWVARTLVSGQTTGQLRGRRSVQRWLDAEQNGQPLPNFAMSPDQFRRYRQVGTYGAYRVVFRAVPQLTRGDGWTPDSLSLELADLVNESLPPDTRLDSTAFERGTRWGHWSGAEVRYWLEHGWPAFQRTRGGLLPTSAESAFQLLPRAERTLLRSVLFADGSVRQVTSSVLARAKGARSHADLCDALANSDELEKQLAPASLAPLPAFSRFADATMQAIRSLWLAVNHDNIQNPSIATLATSDDLRLRLDQLRQAADNWLRAPGIRLFPHAPVVSQLADEMRRAVTPIESLRALARHHHEHGGGRRWFHEEDGKLIPLVPDTGIAASDYRFRLRALCQLSAQCGVADMTTALEVVASQSHDNDDEDNP